MFILLFLRWVLGYVQFSGRGVFVENFLSHCAKKKIIVWGIKRQEEYVFGYVLARSYRKLRKPAKKNGIRIRVIKKVGLPFFISRHYKRVGIFVGGAIFLLVLTVLSNFVWAFEVVGNNNVSEEDITKALSEFGLKHGSYIPSLDIRRLEQQMLLKFDELAWIGININSSVAEIRVHETVFPPDEKRNDDGVFNIVAAQDGLIKRLEVYVGQEVVKVGDSVKKGDLIVSGIVEDPKGHTLLRHARAKVVALVPFEETFEVKLKESYRIDTGEVKSRYTLNVFGKELPLYFSNKVGFENYYTEESDIYPSVFGFSLPFSFKKTVFVQYENEENVLTNDEAKKKAFELYEKFKADLEIDKEYISERVEGESYILTVEGSLRKDIAEEREVLVELKEKDE